MGLEQSRKWALLIVLTIIILSIIHPAASQPSSITRPGRRLQQTPDTYNNIARVDPLDHFNKYKGGYDITNKHYWSSTVFTGIYAYVIGMLWLIAGAVFSIYLLSKASCLQNKRGKLKRRLTCHKQCHLFTLILGTTFAILAIIASGVALGGTIRFHSRSKSVMSVIINTADQASNTMYNATGAMRKISENLKATDSVDGSGAAYVLASTSDKLDYEATDIQRQAEKNRQLVGKALATLYILTTITISLNLAAMIALTVIGILRFQRAIHVLIALCWLLTALCWLLFGAYFFLEKFSADTCTALQAFQQNPDNSSLSSILPCDELLSARTILSDVGEGIYDVVNQVNMNIPLLGSSSLPSHKYICNPFSGPPDYLYQPGNCPADSIHIRDIPQVLKMFTCSDMNGINCNNGFITTSEYSIIEAFATSAQNLLDTFPEMEILVNCQLVKDAFSDILVNHCKPIKIYVKTTWVALMLLSLVMVTLVLGWAGTTYHEQKHHFANGSVKPNTMEVKNMDPEAAKATDGH